MTYRIIIADDHPLLLQALSDIIVSAGPFELLEAAGSGHRALSQIRSLRPEIAVLDLAMPQIGGMEILRACHDNGWPTKIIFLSATMTGKEIADAIDLGVWGLLLKDFATDHLLKCLNAVAEGQKWLPKDLVARAKAGRNENITPTLSLLTPRESEIAQLVARGLSNRAIADTLGSAEGTVGIQLHNIYRKLDIKSRTVLAALLVSDQGSK